MRFDFNFLESNLPLDSLWVECCKIHFGLDAFTAPKPNPLQRTMKAQFRTSNFLWLTVEKTEEKILLSCPKIYSSQRFKRVKSIAHEKMEQLVEAFGKRWQKYLKCCDIDVLVFYTENE